MVEKKYEENEKAFDDSKINLSSGGISWKWLPL